MLGHENHRASSSIGALRLLIGEFIFILFTFSKKILFSQFPHMYLPEMCSREFDAYFAFWVVTSWALNCLEPALILHLSLCEMVLRYFFHSPCPLLSPAFGSVTLSIGILLSKFHFFVVVVVFQVTSN